MEFHKFIEQAGLEKKSYQQEGVDWCVNREGSDEFCKGGIIADEMGLGKTIMMIGTMIQNFKMPNLIILPLVLLEQWSEQFKQTTGHTPLVYYGGVKKAVTYNMLQKLPIVLTTYGTMIMDSKTDKKLQSVRWSRIIFDEAHHMRNKNTHCYKSAMLLKSDIKWLITGTPIQNHINDLYSLFDILDISNKIYTKTDKLRLLMNTIVLKRTKKDVGIKLPQIYTSRVCTVWKNDNEQKLTETVHNNARLDKKMLLAMMMYERMMCIYPNLLEGANMKTIHAMGIKHKFEDGTKHHSKMDSVIGCIVERKSNGNRKIIFTNFKGEIDFIKNKLTEEGMIVEHIDGRVTKRQRKLVLNNVLDVLILQIKTGNEGLNLQQYNEVYFVTPEWNPQTEEQAIARCHRIGQKKDVHVFRFVMDSFDKDKKISNIEMYSEKVQEKKREIEKSICENEIK